jgi:hypothetical protein
MSSNGAPWRHGYRTFTFTHQRVYPEMRMRDARRYHSFAVMMEIETCQLELLPCHRAKPTAGVSQSASAAINGRIASANLTICLCRPCKFWQGS